MDRTFKSAFVLFLVATILVCSLPLGHFRASAQAEKLAVTVREEPERVLLYTVYRGPYDEAGPAIGRLFALAGKNGLMPRGSVAFTYLNNPTRCSADHWLTEISIPVDRSALKLAGTLGEFTDVKVLRGCTVAVAVKPAGMADPAPVYEALTRWVHGHGYGLVGGVSEAFPPQAVGAYEAMQTEIVIPVEKLVEVEAR